MSSPGARIATGGSADVHAWGDRHVLKLYRSGAPADVAEREAARARVAHAAGVPGPAVLDVITIDGRPGIVFERAHGPTMLEALTDGIAAAQALACQLAALHASMHDRDGEGLPSQRQRLHAHIARAPGLPADVTTAAAAALDTLPEGDRMCHGDLHPGNVIMTATGPVIIDWYDATRGDPAADVARTRLIVLSAPLPGHLPAALRQGIERTRAAFFAAYLHHYRTVRPMDDAALNAWTAPVTVARLAEPVSPDERAALVALARGRAARA